MRGRRESTVKNDLFEYDLESYDLDCPVVVINRSNTVTWTPYRPAPRNHHQATVRAAQPLLPPLQESAKNDPLNADYFTNHHRRMEKEEKREMEFDRQRLISGASKIFDQQRALQGPYWQREIGNIVKIENPHDIHEIRTKRKLALEEIGQFVLRFNQMEQERKVKQRRYTEPTRKKPSKPVKRKSMHVSARPPPPQMPTIEPKIWISIPICAFGFAIAQPPSKPGIFNLPNSWKQQRIDGQLRMRRPRIVTSASSPPPRPPPPLDKSSSSSSDPATPLNISSLSHGHKS